MKTYPRGRLPPAQEKLGTGLPKDNGIPTGNKPDGNTNPEKEGHAPAGSPHE